MEKQSALPKVNRFSLSLLRFLSSLVSKTVFRCRLIRNELKNADTEKPALIIANHQSALDFVNILPHLPHTPYTVISRAFYETLPFKFLTRSMGFLSKQQFQTETADLRRMKKVISENGTLLIFPAGLMCESGLSTPIPQATYQFLRFMDADVYVARSYGNYFVNAKWRKGFRSGKTYLDIYKLFDRDELKEMPLDIIKEKTDSALLFDAYAEQEVLKVKYTGNQNIEGLENVLYACPRCYAEDAVEVRDKRFIRCRNCGFEEYSDAYGFLHNEDKDAEIRHPGVWDAAIFRRLKEAVLANPASRFEEKVEIHTIQNGKFLPAGWGKVALDRDCLRLDGSLFGEPFTFSESTKQVYVLPFKPGKHFDIQNGSVSYRCFPESRIFPMKFIHLLKIFHEIKTGECVKYEPLPGVCPMLPIHNPLHVTES